MLVEPVEHGLFTVDRCHFNHIGQGYQLSIDVEVGHTVLIGHRGNRTADIGLNLDAPAVAVLGLNLIGIPALVHRVTRTVVSVPGKTDAAGFD